MEMVANVFADASWNAQAYVATIFLLQCRALLKTKIQDLKLLTVQLEEAK